jgi:hypothetical protein
MKIQEEYWIDARGGLLNASENGEYNHEGHVIEIIVNQIFEFLDIEWTGGPDGIAARCTLNDDVFPRLYGDDEDDPYGRLQREMVRARYFHGNLEEAEAAFRTFSGGESEKDAREFAIKYWNWIRVAGNYAELPNFYSDTLKHLGEAIATILEEEGYQEEIEDDSWMDSTKIDVSIYGKRGRSTATVASLCDGKIEARGADLEYGAAAAVATADRQMMRPTYKGKFGDSLIRFIKLLTD